MSYSPILLVHICAGTLGLLSGTAAMSFRKGSPRHVLAGRVFVVSMLTMAVVAVYLAIVRHRTRSAIYITTGTTGSTTCEGCVES